MSEAETILNSVGVSIRDMSGEVLGVNDILSTLSGKWSSLTDEQRQNIGVTVAGRFQLNRFLALMSNWDIALASTETALHSQGSAINENAKYLQSLEARINRMKSGWEQLSLAFGEAVITDTLITLITVGTSLAGIFTKITESVGVLPVLFGTVAIATYALSTSFKLMIVSTTQAIAGLLRVPLATTAASAGAWSLSAAVKALNFSIKGLLASTGIGLIFVGIGFAAEFLMKKLGNANKEIDDSVDSLTTLGDRVTEITRLTELSSEYESLAKKISLSNDEKIKLSSIESDLQTKYGLSLKALDSEGEGYRLNNELIKQKILLLQEELRVKNESASLDFRSKESSLNNEAQKNKEQTDDMAESLKNAKDALEAFIKAREKNEQLVSPLELTAVRTSRKDFYTPDDKLIEQLVQQKGENLAKAVRNAQEKYDGANIKYQQSINSISQGLRGEFQNYLSVLEGTGTKVESTTRNLFDALASLSAQTGNTKFANEDLNKVFEVFNGANIKNVEDAKKAFLSLPVPLELTAEQLKEIELALKKAQFGTYSDGTEMAVEGTEEFASKSEELKKKLDSTISTLSTLASSYDTLSKGEQLSADSVIDLIDTYPSLAKYLAETNDLTFKKGELLKEVAEADRQTRIVEFQNSLKAVEVTRNELTAKQELYKQFYQKLVDAGSPMDNWMVGSVLTNEEEAALESANKQANDLKAKIAALSQPLSFYGGSSSSKTKKEKSSGSKDEAKLISSTESRINSINALSTAQAKLNDQLSSSITSDSSVASQMSKTTALMASQTKETSLLEAANKKLLVERSNLQKSNSKYNMLSWIDANGEATESYVKLYNSMKSGSAQDSLQSLYDQFSQYTLAVRENRKSIGEIVADNSNLAKSLNDLKLSYTKAYLEKRDASLAAYDSELETSNLVKSLLDEETNAYGREIANQTAILQTKGKALKEDNAWIVNRLEINKKAAKTDKLTSDQIDELTNRLKSNSKFILENEVAVKESIDSYNGWSKSIKAIALDSATSIIEAQKKIDQYNLDQQEKQLDAFKKSQKSRLDNVQAEIDALREKWDLEQEIAERNEFTSEISRLNQVAAILQNNTLTSISDELAKQLNIEELKKREIEYQNSLLEKQKEIQTVQAEKNVRLFENGEFSWVADPRKIKDLQDQITDLEKSHNEDRKDNLDSILEELKGKEASYAEWQKQKDRDAMIALLEQRKEAIEAETALREEKFALEQEAFNSHYEHMDILAAQYLDKLKLTYGSKWDEILAVLEGKLSSAEDMYNKLRGYSGDSLNGGSTSSGSNDMNSSLVEQMQSNSNAWHSASPDEKDKLAKENQSIAKILQAGGVETKYDSKTGKWDILKYHTGLNEGIVGDNKTMSSWLSQKFGLKSNEKLVKLLNGEAVIKNPINMVDNFLSGIRNQQPSFAGISPSTSSVDKSETFNFYGNISVQANDAAQFIKNLRLQVKNK
jgi:hypothetical protein